VTSLIGNNGRSNFKSLLSWKTGQLQDSNSYNSAVVPYVYWRHKNCWVDNTI